MNGQFMKNNLVNSAKGLIKCILAIWCFVVAGNVHCAPKDPHKSILYAHVVSLGDKVKFYKATLDRAAESTEDTAFAERLLNDLIEDFSVTSVIVDNIDMQILLDRKWDSERASFDFIRLIQTYLGNLKAIAAPPLDDIDSNEEALSRLSQIEARLEDFVEQLSVIDQMLERSEKTRSGIQERDNE